jgi:hypothetical protein
MFVCVYSVFVLLFVSVAALRRADPPSKESYRICKNVKKCLHVCVLFISDELQ